ncbi:EAP30 domain-containing protein [Macrophomina phaseolina MS6]|uniref:EAP30 domain-containing protein n=1 Tax=Macrophomina phaseolina (strain MS6) TaxID=1126212 RepID=K2SDC9_MACPH|nr:EAP30 domain-containing protein [Macrophomina phaseolina MS6]
MTDATKRNLILILPLIPPPVHALPTMNISSLHGILPLRRFVVIITADNTFYPNHSRPQHHLFPLLLRQCDDIFIKSLDSRRGTAQYECDHSTAAAPRHPRDSYVHDHDPRPPARLRPRSVELELFSRLVR